MAAPEQPPRTHTFKALLDTMRSDLNRRLDDILENQKDAAKSLVQHESRIAVLESRTSHNPGDLASRISVLEEAMPEELPSRLSVLERLVPHQLSERLRSLEDFKTSSTQAWARWQGLIIAILQFVILGVLGWVIFGRPGPP